MQKIATLTGHTYRVLYLAVSEFSFYVLLFRRQFCQFNLSPTQLIL